MSAATSPSTASAAAHEPAGGARPPRLSRGLPVLLIIPGPAVRLEGCLPTRLDRGGLIVELKGPTDSTRDAQAVWFDRLLVAGARVELWEVRPSSP